MNRNRRFAELVGIHWHKLDAHGRKCIGCEKVLFRGTFENKSNLNPDFAADPRLVLREMKKREDYEQFLIEAIFKYGWTAKMVINLLLDTTGLLRDKAISWIKGKQ